MAADNANRANNADIGASWDVVTGLTAFSITSNEFTPNAGADCAERYTADAPADDQESSVTLGTAVEDTADKGGGAACRISAAATTFYFAIGNTAAAGERQYGKIVAGSKTILGSYTAGATPVTGDKLAIRAEGTRISLRANDVEVAFTTDAAIASGTCGIMAFPWNTASIVDNWEGGGLVLAGPDVTHMWIPPLNHMRG